MPSMEQIEMDRYRARLDRDIADLVDKYLGIMGWDIPEVDEDRARSLIVAEMKVAIERLAAGAK